MHKDFSYLLGCRVFVFHGKNTSIFMRSFGTHFRNYVVVQVHMRILGTETQENCHCEIKHEHDQNSAVWWAIVVVAFHAFHCLSAPSTRHSSISQIICVFQWNENNKITESCSISIFSVKCTTITMTTRKFLTFYRNKRKARQFEMRMTDVCIWSERATGHIENSKRLKCKDLQIDFPEVD